MLNLRMFKGKLPQAIRFSNRIDKFITKRALVLLAVLVILDIVFMRQKWIILLGLLVGAIYSVLRFCVMSSTFSGIIRGESKSSAVGKNIFLYVICQVVAAILLLAAYKITPWLFVGTAAGILLVPFTVFIYCIIQPFRKTNNSFE